MGSVNAVSPNELKHCRNLQNYLPQASHFAIVKLRTTFTQYFAGCTDFC